MMLQANPIANSLPNSSLSLTPQQRKRALAIAAELRRRGLAGTASRWRQIARPNQIAPDGDWSIWLILAGRGFGKTRTINEWAIEQAEAIPGSRGAFVGSTAADVRDVLIEGESGILNISPDSFRPEYEPSKRRLTWPNGTTATLFSADEPNRLRGPQQHWAICDELASWRYPDAWHMLMLGLRLGKNPRCAVATTPKPVKHLRDLLAQNTTHVTRGSTYENRANLATAFFDQIIRRYEGTRIGRQEINAELLDDIPGALWNRAMLDGGRVSSFPELRRIVIGIDPEATSTEDSAETGIVAAGISEDGQGYVLGDYSLRALPEEWARAAISAYSIHKANSLTPEVNNGGEMVTYTIRTIDKNVPIHPVHATRGKYTRAEPISSLYQQGKVHHVGSFAELEDQMCNWLPGDKSPDRLDALVWALSDLMLEYGEDATGETVNADPYQFSTSPY